MKSKDIIELLYKKFESHKYQLANSFIYFWESDWFSVSSTGYVNEIEIKTTYSDFKADFKKISKHNQLRSVYNGKSHFLSVLNLVYEVITPEKFNRRSGMTESKVYSSKQSNRSQESWWKAHNYSYKQIYTEIEFIENRKTPNKFWYICPKDVIPLEEVPEYAGLYYVYENGRIYCKKKAPFIHKEKQDITKILLDKFYYLSQRLKRKNDFYKKHLEKDW